MAKGLVSSLLISMFLAPVGAMAEEAASAPAAEKASSAGAMDKKAAGPQVVTKQGMFTILQADGRTFFAIPENLIGREMFWYAEVADDPPETDGILANTVGSALVRFDRIGAMVYLSDLTDRTRARTHFVQDPFSVGAPSSAAKIQPVNRAVDAADLAPVMLSFPVVDEDPTIGIVIDVTEAFTSDIDRFSVAAALTANFIGGSLLVGAVDPKRSYVRQALAFPENVHIQSLLTFVPPDVVDRLGDIGLPAIDIPLSIVVGHTIALLPETPMPARLFDDRVGYFVTSFTDYDEAGQAGTQDRSIILRRRLEKKNPDDALSEVVEPIVYYIGRGVPDRWRPYIAQAVEDWQPAFEAAGFKNAIVARDAPDAEEDPDWHQADSRYSVIRWVTEPIENAQGPNIHDPRSGEILSAHVLVWADLLKFQESWYFTRVGGVDPRAAKLPLPEDIMGSLLRAGVAHEVGHSLGLRHNFKAAQAYTVAQLRDPEFAKEHGPVASIMSYGRGNHVAQPEDGVTRFIRGIGPYDVFAISWGYKPIGEAETPFDELPVLDDWANAQLDNPWLAFGGEDVPSFFDPTVLTETIGMERIEVARLSLKNLDRVVANLASTAGTPGSADDRLDEMYGRLLDDRTRWIRQVAAMVGGSVEHRAEARAGKGPRFVIVPANEQRKAVDFILTDGLEPPEKFLDPDLLSLFATVDATRPVEESQRRILYGLLDGRVYAMLYQQAFLDGKAFTIAELLERATSSVWAEIGKPGVAITPLRRSLQRAYLDRIEMQIGGRGEPVDTARLEVYGIPSKVAKVLLSRGEGTDFDDVVGVLMVNLADRIAASIELTDDAATRAHLANSLGRVRGIASLTQH